jgi:hypothetical protein
MRRSGRGARPTQRSRKQTEVYPEVHILGQVVGGTGENSVIINSIMSSIMWPLDSFTIGPHIRFFS